jgi:hypothetical protein
MSEPATEAESRSYRITVTVLLGLALLMFAYPMVRIFWNFEIDSNEGWNAYYQLRAIAGQSLYTLDSPLFFNNYPPLSFYLVGALTALVGDPMLAGRAVSLAALLSIALSSGAIVRRAGGSGTDGRLAVATCIGLFAAFATDYLGMNDPQLLGQAFIVAGLAVHLGGPGTARRGAAVALLFAIGVLTKHNLVVVPLVVAVDLLRRGPPAQRAAFFAAGLGLAAAAALVLWLAVGKSFFTQVLATRTWDVARSFLFTTEILGRLQAPLAVVGLGLFAARGRRPSGLIAGYLLLALVAGAGFAGGANTDINVFFDVSIALAIGTGLVAHRLGQRFSWRQTRTVVALAANAGIIFYAPLALGRFGVDVAGEMDRRESLFNADVDYLRDLPGPVLCQSQLLCFRAGRDMYYDSFNVHQAIAAGHLPADVLIDKLERHQIAVVQISDGPEFGDGEYPGVQSMPARYIHFADPVFATLAREYVVDRVGISGRFYRPRQTP